MKKRRKPGLAGWAMFAAMLFATLGPGVCRALMPAGESRPEATCCDDESRTPPQGEPKEGCPLHAVGHIQLLPAPARSLAPAAPDAPIGGALAFAAPAIRSEFLAAPALSLHNRGHGPAPNSRTPLYLLIESLRI